MKKKKKKTQFFTFYSLRNRVYNVLHHYNIRRRHVYQELLLREACHPRERLCQRKSNYRLHHDLRESQFPANFALHFGSTTYKL